MQMELEGQSSCDGAGVVEELVQTEPDFLFAENPCSMGPCGQ